MENKFRPKTQEQLVRQLSRVTLNAKRRNKLPLLEKLTAANADKIEALSEQKPIFYENQEDAPTRIQLDPEIQPLFPPEFFRNPTKWIESQPNIKRHFEEELPKGENINELKKLPYDISKVKEFTVFKIKEFIIFKGKKPIKITSKRITPDQINEIERQKRAYAAGLPTTKVLGEIMDRGNNYAFLEKIEGVNLDAALIGSGIFKNSVHYFGDVMKYAITHKNIQDRMSYDFIRKLSREAKEKLLVLSHEYLPHFRKYMMLLGINKIIFLADRCSDDAPASIALSELSKLNSLDKDEHNLGKQTEQILEQT